MRIRPNPAFFRLLADTVPWLGLAALAFATGCGGHHPEAPVTQVEITDVAREAQIPKLIMSEVDDELAKDAKNAPLYIFMPLQVQFSSLSEDALAAPELRYQLPKGGGRIDLKDIVTGFGSFYMHFPAAQFGEGAELLHLYYVSNSPVRRIDGEDFGLGCGKMLDLKKSFNKLQKPGFLKLNSVERRYLAVLAGRYIFVMRQGVQIQIAQLTVNDSRYPQELCMGDI